MTYKTLFMFCLIGALAYGCGSKKTADNVQEVTANGVSVAEANPNFTVFEETPEEHDARMEWWRQAKFGLFIHWGVYAVPAGSYGDNSGYGEWIMHNAKIPVKEYKGFAKQFNPVKYDPNAWVKVAKDAGMRYIVITAKHHDGFALYPSKFSSWNVADATPYGKDLLGPLVEASKKQGLKIGFYYSQSQDWVNPGGAKKRYKEGEGWDDAQLGDFDDYLEKVALPQVKELFNQYPIDMFWWDTGSLMNEERARPFAEAIPFERGILSNNRLGGGFAGDFGTPEQFVPATGYQGDWETCMTMNGHWGYNAADNNWKSTEELIHKLIDICAKGGNFLLNIGPTAEGEFPEQCIERLQEVGAWLDVNGESIYGTTRGPFTYLSYGAATRKGNKVYVHVFDWPGNGKLNVPLRSGVKSASLLVTPDKPLKINVESERIVIDLPKQAPDLIASVVVLELNEEPEAVPIASAGKAINVSSSAVGHPAECITDGNPIKYWEADEADTAAWMEFDLGKPTLISAFAVDEPDKWPRYRQNIQIKLETSNGWKDVISSETVGHGIRTNFEPVLTQYVRLYIQRDLGAPAIAEWQLYSPE
jgi:alpha-L-fucosidase